MLEVFDCGNQLRDCTRNAVGDHEGLYTVVATLVGPLSLHGGSTFIEFGSSILGVGLDILGHVYFIYL